MSRYYPLVVATLCAFVAVLLIWSTGAHSALFAPASDDGSPGAARLRLEETRRDLGNLSGGKPARASFRVANEGSHRLVIRKETGHCCGRGGPEEITIVPPGESRSLVVDVDTTGIQGGLQSDIKYATNDPRMPRFTLTVVGRVGLAD
jgi:hypothetical protein